MQFVRETAEECMTSRETRRIQSRLYRNLYYTGSTNAIPSKYNRSYSHVDKLSSFIFSPVDLKFALDFTGSGTERMKPLAQAASRQLNTRFNKDGCGVVFAQANETSLIEGCSIVKLNWGTGPAGGRLEPWMIRPIFFGVLREDIEDLDRQEAMVHSYYVTPSAFKRMIHKHEKREELKEMAKHVLAAPRSADELGDSYFHEIVTGGLGPISVPGTLTGGNAPSYGQVGISATPGPMLSPEVAADLIRIDDLWVWNDLMEDWTTLRYIEAGNLLLEGKYKHRNLFEVKGHHPFTKVCSTEVSGYFWGRSELATVYENQMLLNKRMNEIDTIFGLRTKPPRAFSGFQSLTEEKARALLAPGSMITEQAIGAKVDNLAPEMPAEAMDYLGKLEDIFDDVGGFTNILSGQGEPGVRAGVHAGVLLRTSTPRLRDRSLLVEIQCAKVGGKALKLLQMKDANVYETANPELKLVLSQLPADTTVDVDSHTSSPAFSEDNKQMAFALAKAQVIDGETLLEMVHPPREDELIDRLRTRLAAQAQFAKDNPVAAAEAEKAKK